MAAPLKDGTDDGVLWNQANLLEAFERLYESYEPLVERWVRRLGGPSVDVEDLVHDVFVVAVRRRHEFRGEAKLSTWLFRIAENVVRKRRARDRLVGFFYRRYRDDRATLQPASPTPLEELERRQQHARLYAALDRLPEKYRTVLILYDIDGRSAEEVAALLGLRANAVWVRVHRGRALLLEQLASHRREP